MQEPGCKNGHMAIEPERNNMGQYLGEVTFTYILVATKYKITKLLFWKRYKFDGCLTYRIEAPNVDTAIAIAMEIVDHRTRSYLSDGKDVYKIDELYELEKIPIKHETIDTIPYKGKDDKQYYDYLKCKS